MGFQRPSMPLRQNRWDLLKKHYALFTPQILAERKNEWAIDAYAWEGQGMLSMTPIEAWLWADIREANCVLYPQYPVAGFFVDFANPKARVAIECDGAAYHQDKAKDADCDRKLADLGWTVYRITGSECRTDSDEETGAPGFALRFIQHICDAHGISRAPWWQGQPYEREAA